MPATANRQEALLCTRRIADLVGVDDDEVQVALQARTEGRIELVDVPLPVALRMHAHEVDAVLQVEVVNRLAMGGRTPAFLYWSMASLYLWRMVLWLARM